MKNKVYKKVWSFNEKNGEWTMKFKLIEKKDQK